MKKIILLFMLIAFCSPVFADAIEPQWSEFCPGKFVYVAPKEYKPRNLIKDFIYPLIGGAWENTNQAQWIDVQYSNYWYQRRLSFENSINNCKNIIDNGIKTICYLQVRQIENEKTSNKINQATQGYRPIIIKNSYHPITCNPNYAGGYNCY